MKMKINVNTMKIWPYAVVHKFACHSHQWDKMIEWCNSVLGEQGNTYCINSQSIMFRNKDDAKLFELIWCSK